MQRVIAAGLLALPGVLALAPAAHAQTAGCASGNCNTIAAPGGTYNPGGCTYLGCGACFRFLDKIHQHGPLFNYGPYSGYYPFEPYGPWGADLRYKLPWPPQSDCGGCGRCAKCAASGLFHKGGCGGSGCGGSGWGSYSLATLKNVFHRVHPGSKSSSCGTCGGSGTPVSTDGPGTPIAVAPTDPVVQTGYPRRER